MYKVDYQKVVIMKDGTHGNISQGRGTAYMRCGFSDIKNTLKRHLSSSEYPKKHHPIILKAEHIKGHVVI